MWANITPVPNAVFDCHLRELKIAEIKVLLVIVRQTLGWEDKTTKSERKESDWIAGKQLREKTGCSKRAIISAVRFLVAKNLIVVSDEYGNILDTSERRQGKQKLFYRISPALFSLAEKLFQQEKFC